MNQKQQKLILHEGLLIGRGKVRQVYRHPHDRNLCIKITFNHSRRRAVAREIRYLKRYARLGKPFTHLVRFHGYCMTNLGQGTLFDLVRNYDGRRADMLSDHVSGTITPPLSPVEIVDLLEELYQHLLANSIIVCDPAPHNLLVHYPQPQRPKLVIVDGIGNPHFIKIADYTKKYADRLIHKKWRYYVRDNLFLHHIFALAEKSRG